ncbi:secretion system protein [Cellulomonas hominis]|uniref:Secretion system protein n=1 Tax=Cellulomonas hominis TaxID=156981 RepID=A0A511FD48_9CELL|nr:type II secretion system F family protein [Cellulomonas hominis]MBB5474597.1 type IV pilus assembly protein PilC [Cellulomonas hominis]NKY05470.1 type II secretion system F family protein [Cellulomonas hominis]GEL47151.1 secretion system protein [Cellulomonas hominis]
MPQFDVRYLVDGAIVRESVTADDLDEVHAGAKVRGHQVLSAKKIGSGLQMQIGGPKRVKPAELTQFVRMFATVVAADLPVLQALRMMACETDHPTLASAIDAVAADLENGSSLAEGFARHPSVFPPQLVTTVEAAETGGFLDRALLAVAETLEDQGQLASDVKQASTYPVVVLFVGVLASVGMSIFLLPRFATMFDDLGGELPLPTRIALGMSDVMTWLAPLGGVAGFAGWFWWRRNKHLKKVRAVVDPLKLRLPVFGPIMRKIAVSRVTRTLALLLDAGVPQLQAIPKAAPTANNLAVERALLAAGEYVALGEDLSKHLSDGDVIPGLVSQMLAAGEKVGKPGEMLERVSRFYHSAVTRATKQLSSAIEPVLIVVVGLMVGFQILAIYMPMFSMFDLIG